MRELLPGWRDEHGQWRVDVGPMALTADHFGEWTIGVDECFGYSGDGLTRTKLAAEDAARKLAADIVAALGGSVTWPESEAPDA